MCWWRVLDVRILTESRFCHQHFWNITDFTSPTSVQLSPIVLTLTWLVFPLLWAFLHFRHLIVTKLIVTTSSNAKAMTSKILLFENPSSKPRMKFLIRGEYSVTISEGSYCKLKPSFVLSKGWRTATRGSSESVE